MASSLVNMPAFITHILTLQEEGAFTIRQAGEIASGERKAATHKLYFDPERFDALIKTGDHTHLFTTSTCSSLSWRNKPIVSNNPNAITSKLLFDWSK